MSFNLDANVPDQVASASYLEFDIGQPDKKAVIFSGIAIPNWHVDDDSNTAHDTVVVNLRYKVLAVEQVTITAGLASIFNDDSTFLYATDETSLCIDNDSQELKLTVNVAVMGSSSNLSRISYQVVVIATTQVTGISGTIRMNKDVAAISSLPENEIVQLFLISAGRLVALPLPPNTPGLPAPVVQYTPLAYGQITGMTETEDDYNFAYHIPGAPYNEDLFVQPQVGPLFPTDPAVIGTVIVNQIPAPSAVRLTVANPSVGAVDFRATRIVVK